MRLNLKLLVLVDEMICEYKYVKQKLDKLVMEVAHVHVVSHYHWGQAMTWMDSRFLDWRRTLSVKEKLDPKNKGNRKCFPHLPGDSYTAICPRIRETRYQAEKRRVQTMKGVETVVVFWDTSDDEIEALVKVARDLEIPVREFRL